MLAEGLIGGDFAHEVVFVGRAHAGVAVGRADHAELVGVHTDLGLHLQAPLQGRAGVVGLAGRGGGAGQEFAADLELAEFIRRIELGTHLGGALHLGDLHQRLPQLAGPGVLGGERAAVAVDHVEHQPAGQVGVVRDGDEVDPRARLGGLQEGPQVLRTGAVDIAVGIEGAGFLAVGVAEHDAMEVLAAGHGGPFPSEQGGELAGDVVLFGGVDLGLPGRLAHLGRVDLAQLLVVLRRIVLDRGAAACRHGAPDRILDVGVQHLLAPGRGHQPGVALVEHDLQSEHLGVVGHRQEIQRTLNLHLGVQACALDRDAAGVAIGEIGRGGVVAGAVGVQRVVGVQVHVAPVEVRLGRTVRGRRGAGGDHGEGGWDEGEAGCAQGRLLGPFCRGLGGR